MRDVGDEIFVWLLFAGAAAAAVKAPRRLRGYKEFVRRLAIAGHEEQRFGSEHTQIGIIGCRN